MNHQHPEWEQSIETHPVRELSENLQQIRLQERRQLRPFSLGHKSNSSLLKVFVMRLNSFITKVSVMSLDRLSPFKTTCSRAMVGVLSLVMTLTCFLSPAAAHAQTLESAQAELARAEASIAAIAEQTQAASNNLSATMTQSDEVNAEIAQKEEELEAKRAVLAKRMNADYKGGSTNILDVLLSSTSFEELASNLYYFAKIASSDANLINEVASAKESLEQTKTELDALQAEQQAQLEDIQAKQNEVQSIINGLSAEVREMIAEQDAGIIDGGGGDAPGPAPTPGPSPAPSDKGQAIVEATLRVPSPGAGYCAAWVSRVYYAAGCGYPGGNAVDMYYRYCSSSNRADLQPGMIIAVPSSPYDAAGRIYGHVGIYIGNGQVRDNIGYIHTGSLDTWINYYSAGGSTPRWGWA